MPDNNSYNTMVPLRPEFPSEVYWERNNSETLMMDRSIAPLSTESGGSPGGNPGREPLPIGDALIPLLMIAFGYVLFLIKKARK